VATVALLILITDLAIDVFQSSSPKRSSVVKEGFHNVGGVRFANDDVVIAVVAIVLAIGFSLFFRYTTLGIAIRAPPTPARSRALLGINANAVAGFAWAMGSMLAWRRRRADRVEIIGATRLPRPPLPDPSGVHRRHVRRVHQHAGHLPRGLALGVIQNVFVNIHWPTRTLTDMFSAAGRRRSSPSWW